jgi:hypothetical protein
MIYIVGARIQMVDPITGFSLFKAVAEAAKKIAEVAKDVKDYDNKKKLGDVHDILISLKQAASELEDENRELKEELRFKSDDFEFRNPFWYEKEHPDRALCPKCFVEEKISPVSAPFDNGIAIWRKCLACGTAIEEAPSRKGRSSDFYGGPGGPESWMGR